MRPFRKPAAAVPTTTTTMSLDQVEHALAGAAARIPNSAVIMNETARVLQVLSSGGIYGTLVGERCADGIRIVEGRHAVDVARVLRARASWRGDHFWALELGRQLQFRVIVRDETTSRPGRAPRRATQRAARSGRRPALA